MLFFSALPHDGLIPPFIPSDLLPSRLASFISTFRCHGQSHSIYRPANGMFVPSVLGFMKVGPREPALALCNWCCSYFVAVALAIVLVFFVFSVLILFLFRFLFVPCLLFLLGVPSCSSFRLSCPCSVLFFLLSSILSLYLAIAALTVGLALALALVRSPV